MPGVMASGAVVLAITLVLLLVVEGAASVIVVSRGHGKRDLSERAHTEFDPELGWINKPSIRVDNLYGPGLYLETNSQRTRNRHDFDRKIPRGRVRAICAGDSFTLGHGVRNDDAWCELLGQEDARFETVNMGQGGYGVDQAYLWYRRDGRTLDHDVLIFAFVATDFHRMRCSKFYGYPKPVLSVRDGKPVIERRSSWLEFVARGLSLRLQSLTQLRFAELWHSWKGAAEAPAVDPEVMTLDAARRLALAMFDDLAGIHAAKNTSLLVVLLPVFEDYQSSEADEWQSFLHDELGGRGIPFLDLVRAMREESGTLVPRLFRGHYNEIGNRWVADRLHAALVELPHVRDRLQKIGEPSHPVAPLMPNDVRQSFQSIPLQGIAIRTNVMEDQAQRALDGAVSTRWSSGVTQSGHEEIVLDLGTSRTFREVKLDLGEWSYDYGRQLALDVGEDEAHYRELLNVEGTRVIETSVDRPGDAQLLILKESATARYVRVRQLSRAEDNFWSVAEIRVFSEK